MNTQQTSNLSSPSTTIMKNMGIRRRGVIAVIGGPKIGASVILPENGQIVVGSSKEADFQIDGRGISRRHFRAYWEAGKIYIEDLRSSNGTKVNNQKITQSTEITSRDKIQIGVTTVLKCS